MTEEKEDLINLKEIVDFKWILNSLLEENEKLKKQLKKRKELLNKFKIQQKEFIKYLKKMLDDENDIFSVVRVEDVLQKYKEIIGSDK